MNSKNLLLSEINLAFIQTICTILSIKTEIKLSSEFKLIDGKTARLVNLCNQLDITDYYSGPAAKVYLDENLFLSSNIKVHYLDYSDYPIYTQQFESFAHDVSILDLIFNEGPNAYKFMKSFSQA